MSVLFTKAMILLVYQLLVYKDLNNHLILCLSKKASNVFSCSSSKSGIWTWRCTYKLPLLCSFIIGIPSPSTLWILPGWVISSLDTSIVLPSRWVNDLWKPSSALIKAELPLSMSVSLCNAGRFPLVWTWDEEFQRVGTLGRWEHLLVSNLPC